MNEEVNNNETIENSPVTGDKKKKRNFMRFAAGKLRNMFLGLWNFIKTSPLFFKIAACTAILCGVIHILSYNIVPFADFVIRYPNAVVRFVLAKLTNLIPFSVGEMIVILLPLILFSLIYLGIRLALKNNNKGYKRYLSSLLSVLFIIYSLFVLTLAPGYRGSSLAQKTGLEQNAVSAEELYDTSVWLSEMVDQYIGEVDFSIGGSSIMPYSLDEMNDKLNDAYAKLCKKYDFVSPLKSNIKYVILSKPWTYTHISGVYTYYTGESNLNVNFPDYTLPFTAAHEFAHQRGTAPENEANFVAFLACIESDDPYILYSAYSNMLEYCMNALYSADHDMYYKAYGKLDRSLAGEFSAYSLFFEKYRENTAATVSNTVNDTYLKSQGQTAGSQSYGLVVDLAVSYYNSISKK